MNRRIGLVAENSVNFVEQLLKIWGEGDCAVIIDCRIPFGTICDMFLKSGVTEAYIETSVMDKFVDSTQKIKFIEMDTKKSNVEYIPNYIKARYAPNYEKTEAVIFYSSGTTGNEKGIILTHYAINVNADAIIKYMNPKRQETIYIVKSLAHSSTVVGELLVGLKTGMSILLGSTIASPRVVFNNISKYNVNILCVNPALLRLYSISMENVKHQISSLRIIYTSGSVLKEIDYIKAKKVMSDVPIVNVYGMTEAGPRITANNEEAGNCSVGKAIECSEVVIVDSKGKVVEKGEKGFVHVNTLCRFSGYVEGQKVKDSLYKDWLNTGDVGYVDENDYLYIVGRSDNMIVNGSHNVYPEEIEKIILLIEDVRECLVFGVNDEFLGKKIVCFYESENVSEKELRSFCKERLASYEIPNQFFKVNKIPLNENGKASYKLALSLYEKGGLKSGLC